MQEIAPKYWDFLFLSVNNKSYLIASLRLNAGKVTFRLRSRLKTENPLFETIACSLTCGF